MGVGEINVAYDGTFGDLSGAEDAGLFGLNGDGFDFELMDSADNSFTAINGSTISPKDLLNDVSVPPSSSFTNLTTPGSTVIETPDDYQTSPLFTDSMATENNWFSLFPDDHDSTNQATSMTRTESTSSVNQVVVHPGGEGNRKRSATTVAAATSPSISPVTKHSTVAGVNARKRDKPLPPIIVDETDSVALKRARNTAAARKSRAKKVQERDDLESQIAALQSEVEFWKNKALGRDPGTAIDE